MREAVAAYRARTFKSLAVRNYRLYFIGQGISISGTWMQSVAQGLLVLELTGSGTQLGLVTALRSIPVLAFGAMGGVIADRYPKRKLLYASQTMAGLLGLTLGILVATGEVQMWMVDILAVLLGFVSVVDNPTRQSLILELVGPDQIRNAVSLNSTEVNLARVIGPTLAGILVSTVGLAACFIVDGVSYFAVIVMLMRMREDEMFLGQTVSRARGQLREGFAYAWANLPVRKTLIMMAIIGTFTYEFNVILPIFAEFTFESGPSAYAAMTAAMGLGAVVGGLSVAGRVRTSQWSIVISAALFGCSVLLTALAPTLYVAVGLLLVVGYFSISFTTMGNSTIQLATDPTMRGRVMALWTVSFLGTTPIGGPIIGAIGEHIGARWGLLVGGVAALIAAAYGARGIQRVTSSDEVSTVERRPAS
jgi:MFS family permease